MVLIPTTASYEAEYVEHYLAWCGPVKTTRKLAGEPLLSDFADLVAAVKPGTPAAPAAPAARPDAADGAGSRREEVIGLRDASGRK